MISRTRSRIATSNPSRREPSWPTSLTMLAFAMAYSSCALNLQSRDSGLSPLLTSQENTPSLFLQESGRSPHSPRCFDEIIERIAPAEILDAGGRVFWILPCRRNRAENPVEYDGGRLLATGQSRDDGIQTSEFLCPFSQSPELVTLAR